MRNRKKQLLLLLVFVALLFLASGCTSPVDPETKEVIQITSETTFKYMMANENWFNAFFVFPLSKCICPISTPGRYSGIPPCWPRYAGGRSPASVR